MKRTMSDLTVEHKSRVVIVGGGFGGLLAAKGLADAPFDVTLIDRNNHHLFQPLLYQVATAGLSPADIASPIRGILSGQRNIRIMLAEVSGVDIARKEVIADGKRVKYDYLVLATGARHGYFGHDNWAKFAPGLKTIDDATYLRRRILLAFERAENETDVDERRRLMTFVVVGGGPTGVEMAGAIAELAKRALVSDFRSIDPLRLGAAVTNCSCEGVRLGDDFIPTRTIIWAAGVIASPAGRWLGAEIDRAGRVKVRADLSVPGHPEVFVIGDTAAVTGANGTIRRPCGQATGPVRRSRTGSAASRTSACGILLSRFRFARHYRPLTCCRPVRQTPTFGLSGLVAVECGPRLLSDRVPQPFRSRPQLGVELHYLRTRQPPHHWPLCAPGGYASVAASRASFESKLE